MDRATTYPFRAVGIAPLNDDPDPAQGYPTRIGHDVWIGDGATIMAGSIIGHGAVIGARAVVAGIVPPYAIVAGNPARLIRMRFSRETIDQLLAEAWWDWPIERIRESVDYLYRLPESEREGRSSWLSKIIKRLRLG
jgi:virginiamycin A acetyltransferase